MTALQERVFTWFAGNRRDLPWRRTADPYAILVSEVMLQQTQVARVVLKFAAWMDRFPSLEALAAADLTDVLAMWSGLGYNNRGLRLWECAGALTEAQSAAGQTPAALPRTLDELRALPGVGPYTARAILIFAYNADLAAVDANVRRVLTHELDLPHRMKASQLQRIADAVLPAGRSRDWHNALMDYGALVLTSRTTGISPRTRQTRFQGSRRQTRARMVRELLAGPLPVSRLAAHMDRDPGLIEELAAELEREGLLVRSGDDLRIR